MMNSYQLRYRGMGKDRIHITDGINHTFINKEEKIPEGWRRGHSDASIQKMREAKLGKPGVNKGRSWYHNEITGESRMFYPDDDRVILEDGWVKGRQKKSSSKRITKLVSDVIEIGGDSIKEYTNEVIDVLQNFSGDISEIYTYLVSRYRNISRSVVSTLSVILQSIINREPHNKNTKWISLKSGKTKRINKGIEDPIKGLIHDKPKTQFIGNPGTIYGRVYDYENSVYKEPGKYYTDDLDIKSSAPIQEIDKNQYDIYQSLIELATVL